MSKTKNRWNIIKRAAAFWKKQDTVAGQSPGAQKPSPITYSPGARRPSSAKTQDNCAQNTARPRVSRRKFAMRAVATVSMSVVLATMMTPASAFAATTNDNHAFPTNTTAINDSSTTGDYAVAHGDNDPFFGNTTADAGKTWTDKTVVVPTSGNTEGATATYTMVNGQNIPVDKATEGVFQTSLSALTSSMQVSSTPTPLDIVLVLDVSGSMNYDFGGDEDYYPVYNNYVDDRQAGLT
ncbi:MAG: hypothetical protein ACOYIP_00730 [Coriobacteriales bacterium]|jgi:hypothetical protein